MIGESAGRAPGNRTGVGAKRRATERERAAVDPPGRNDWRKAQTRRARVTARGYLVAGVALDFLATLGALAVANWIGWI